ncbi:uncharacterized protein BX664DRAFT_292391 [Halteromyces radiatus]|uniref:uncharacterized protein n=1 Tax=Halteromyces radiatus TaxID=101107 RepID=UPI002221111E|nr:uncharacterized protein BX664DRAFT_292391 [Halteromyces radiatus]KAI8097079.1 hypothetical protein BX664DRAFT_292391 [Halteromyces radiatus]
MTSPAKPIKGILKHHQQGNSSSTNEPHLKWDEDNLMLTEQQKDSTMKVDEPKTPYIRYDAQTDQVMNLPDNLGYRAKLGPEDIDEFALDGGHESDRSSVSSGRKVRQVSISDDEWADSGDEEEDEQAKKRHEEFAKKRAMHYNMGNVLHHPIRNDEDDEDDDEEDEENTTVKNHDHIPPVPPLPQ